MAFTLEENWHLATKYTDLSPVHPIAVELGFFSLSFLNNLTVSNVAKVFLLGQISRSTLNYPVHTNEPLK